jgi:hypothetical protein
MSEVIGLALTQAIECYMEMEPEAAYDAIIADWHEQLAVILVEFFFKTTCNKCGGMPDFIEMSRESSDSNYIVPICSCDWKNGMQPTRPTTHYR